jgi:6-methylsalicylate decarboxylase
MRSSLTASHLPEPIDDGHRQVGFFNASQRYAEEPLSLFSAGPLRTALVFFADLLPPGRDLSMTPAPATAYRVDTHHHILPPLYLAEERERILQAAGPASSGVLDWSPARALEEMDRNDVMLAIASISTPGVWFGDQEQGRRLARLCNEFGATIIREHPGRFGMFAALPLPDIEGSMREIEYALDVLKLDGIGLMTNYADHWPGDPAFASIFDELNRRHAVVYFHPTAPTCIACIPDVSASVIEFPTDTTRAVTSLLFNGTLSRCPNIRFIFSHGGGTLPMIVMRIVGTLKLPAMQAIASRMPQGPMYEIQKLHFDTASAANTIAFGALSKLLPMSQLLFGSDFPYWPISRVVEGLGEIGLTAEDLRAIERDNALRLLPEYDVRVNRQYRRDFSTSDSRAVRNEATKFCH